MKGNRLGLLLLFLIVCTPAEAAIPLNLLRTFDAAPAAEDWATHSAAGGGSSILFPADLDVAIQTNQVSVMTNVLRAIASSTTFGLAQWNSTGGYLQTRPAGVAYQVVIATLQNTTNHPLSSVAIVYDFGNPSPVPSAEDAGLNGVRAYYSLTGQASSWVSIPEFTTSQTGSVAAVVTLQGQWAPGSLLYLLWADDNGGPGTDSAFTIDNFIALDSIIAPPPGSIQPPGTNVLEGRTVQLSFVGGGLGLTFQWLKDGLPLDPVINPTAQQRTLIITNVSVLDAGQYAVIVSNPAGGGIAGPVRVDVGHFDPLIVMLFAYDLPNDSRGFRLNLNEQLCTDFLACGGDASSPFLWGIFPENRPEDIQFPAFVVVNGTNVDFTMENERVPGQRYVIKMLDPANAPQIRGSSLWAGTSIASAPSLYFQQSLNGYTGTQDTELKDGLGPGGTNNSILVDQSTTVGQAQGLLRFDDLFGSGSNQLPLGSRIHSATLSLSCVDAGGQVNLHRMLSDWNEATAVIGMYGAGIQADGVVAATESDASFNTSGRTSPFTTDIDVTASVRAWVAGQPNYGWAMLSRSADGFTFESSESFTPPALSIIFDLHGDPCSFDTTQPPQGLVVQEGASFTLFGALSVQGPCSLLFQWMKDGLDILGATNGPTYSVAAASLCDTGAYRLRVSSPSLSLTSSPTVVTMLSDVVRPVLTRAYGGLNGTNITLTFSKAMNPSNAVNIAHYTMEPPLAVTGAALSPDGRTVTLTTAPRTLLTPYTLRLQDVTDNRAACIGSIGNVISPNPTIVPLTGVRIDVPWDSEWLYSTNSQDATLSTPTPWYAPNFSPGPDWFTGQALFGTETSIGIVAQFPTLLITSIPPNINTPPDQITTYFRKQIDLPPLPPSATYALCHFIDDGAVFYLDGTEIGRVNLTNATPLLFAHRAAAAIEASVQCLPFTASAGSHTLAVEVHQGGLTTSADILFGVQIEAVASTPELALATGQPLLSWIADSSWELVTSTNAAGPYTPLAVNSTQPLGSYQTLPTNPISFFRLRYKGAVK